METQRRCACPLRSPRPNRRNMRRQKVYHPDIRIDASTGSNREAGADLLLRTFCDLFVVLPNSSRVRPRRCPAALRPQPYRNSLSTRGNFHPGRSHHAQNRPRPPKRPNRCGNMLAARFSFGPKNHEQVTRGNFTSETERLMA